MNTGAIRTLKPNVTQEEALRAFSAAGFSAFYWRIRSGPLCRIAEVYVQYFLFHVKHGSAPPRLFAMDAVDGSLDLFEFPRIPDYPDLLTCEGRNPLECMIEEGKLPVRDPGRYDIREFLTFTPEDQERYRSLLQSGEHPREALQKMEHGSNG